MKRTSGVEISGGKRWKDILKEDDDAGMAGYLTLLLSTFIVYVHTYR